MHGRLVACLLAKSWCIDPPASPLSVKELASITPLLLESGGGALAWCRVRNSYLKDTPAATELRQAYRLHTLQAALHARNIKQVFMLFRAAGIEPLLVKGWAIARLYTEPGTRPYGDIDLCVSPADYLKAQDVLRAEGHRYPVDLHKDTGQLDDRGWDELLARSQLVLLEDVPVRIPAAEDHLRILCYHLLRHGVERPLGLCDIAVALESRPCDFSWNMCLGTNPKRANWVVCTIALAQRLLDASTDNVPATQRDARLPSWLVNSVLKAWGKPFSQHFARQDSIIFSLRHPRGLVQALSRRWPTPIVGTVGVGGAFGNTPRFPYQLGYLRIRSRRFLKGRLRAEAAQDRFFA